MDFINSSDEQYFKHKYLKYKSMYSGLKNMLKLKPKAKKVVPTDLDTSSERSDTTISKSDIADIDVNLTAKPKPKQKVKPKTMLQPKSSIPNTVITGSVPSASTNKPQTRFIDTTEFGRVYIKKDRIRNTESNVPVTKKVVPVVPEPEQNDSFISKIKSLGNQLKNIQERELVNTIVEDKLFNEKYPITDKETYESLVNRMRRMQSKLIIERDYVGARSMNEIIKLVSLCDKEVRVKGYKTCKSNNK
jgi:hypothetical protein